MTNTDALHDTLKDGYADEALNIAVAHIQRRLGVTDGGYASYFFADTEEEIKAIFKDYIEGELAQQFFGESE